VVPVADRRLGHLRDQRLRVAQQQDLHLAVAMELLLEQLCGQTVSVTCALHDRLTRSAVAAHEQRHADEAFIPHHRDFRRCPVFHHIQQRYDRVDGKIDVPHCVAGFVQDLAVRHIDQLEVREQAASHLGRQCCQKMVLLRLGLLSHVVTVLHQQRRACQGV